MVHRITSDTGGVMAPITSQVLRRRARGLRLVADDIERSPVLRLDTDTGAGGHGSSTRAQPRSLMHPNLLSANQDRLHSDADGLRWNAYFFELQAEQLAALEASRPGRRGALGQWYDHQ